MAGQYQFSGNLLPELNASGQMIEKSPAIGSLDKCQERYISELELVSLQEIGGSQIEPANPAITVECDVGNWR